MLLTSRFARALDLTFRGDMPMLPPPRHLSLLTFGRWATLNWHSSDTYGTRCFAYMASHTPEQQRAAYLESCRKTGLRFHEEGPVWLSDPNSVCSAPVDGYPSRYHHEVLQRFGEASLHDLARSEGDPWEIPPDAWTGIQWQDRIAGLLLWFIGLSLTDFHIAHMRRVTPLEFRSLAYQNRLREPHRAAVNGWRDDCDLVLAYYAAAGKHPLDPRVPGMTWTHAAPPRAGVYFMDRDRSHRWGHAIRGLNVSVPITVPRLSGCFDAWLTECGEGFARICPGRRAIIAGERGYFESTEDAIAFKLAAGGV